MFFMRNQPSNHPLVYVWWHVFNFAVPVIQLVRGLLELTAGKDRLTWERLLAPAQLAALMAVWGPLHGLWLWTVMHGAAVYLLVVVSTPVHRSEYSWTEGCDSAVPAAADFGHHTVISTADYLVEEDIGLAAQMFAFGSFNDHVIHHLFPTIDVSRQHVVREVFLQQCKEFGIPYRNQTFGQLLGSTFRAMVRRSPSLAYRPHGTVEKR